MLIRSHLFAVLVLGVFQLSAVLTRPALADETSAAYFVFEQPSPDRKKVNRFVFKLLDQDRIGEARSILAGRNGGRRSVMGTIVKRRAPYNPQWSFHLEPSTISFFENAVEVCDANMTYIEEHLEEIGGSALPRSHWCPWQSILTEELTSQIDPATETPAR